MDVERGCMHCSAGHARGGTDSKNMEIGASKKWINYFPALVNVSAPENKKVHFGKAQLGTGRYSVMPPLARQDLLRVLTQ